MSKIGENNNSVSRKNFIKKSGASLLGVTAAATLTSGLITGCDEQAAQNGKNIEVPSWPFPYEKLDPEKAAERAYDAYQRRIDEDVGG